MKNFKLILKSLVNNEACVEGGRKKPWYFAIIMLFISLIICLVPSFVSTANTSGSNFVATANGYEVATRRFSEDIRERGINMSVRESNDGEKYMSFSYEGKSGAEAWSMAYPEVNVFGHHCYKHVNADGLVDMEIFFIDARLTNDYLNEVQLVRYTKEDGTTAYQNRTMNYIIFGKYEIVSVAFRGGRAAGSLSGDYKYVENGFGVASLASIVVDGVTYDKDLAMTHEGAYGAYVRGVWLNWKCFFDQTYLNNKYTAMWTRTLIMAGIYLAIAVFMGLMVFLLTRGKTNPFRIYTIWDTQKIVYWAAPAPAVLSLIIGFMISSFADIAFPLLMGMRLMWLSMKTLRPENAQVVSNQKPNTQNKNANAKTVSSKMK